MRYLINLLIAGCFLGFVAQAHGACVATTDNNFTLGAPGTTTPTSLPFPNGSGFTYDVCPASNPFCDQNAGQGLWLLIPEMFGLSSSGSGTAYMDYTGTSGVVTTVDLHGIAEVDGVVGYPNIMDGVTGGGEPVLGQGPQFPLALSSLMSMTVSARYNLQVNDMGANHDVLLDEFIQPSAAFFPTDPSQLEVAVFLYYDFALPLNAQYIGTFSNPATINGVSYNTWQEYLSIPGGASIGTVWFFPSPTAVLQANTPYGFKRATVKIAMLPFLTEAQAVCGSACQGTFYIEGNELGSEFGHTTDPNFIFTVRNLQVQTCS